MKEVSVIKRYLVPALLILIGSVFVIIGVKVIRRWVGSQGTPPSSGQSWVIYFVLLPNIYWAPTKWWPWKYNGEYNRNVASGKEVILVELRQEVGTATAGEAVRWKRAGLRRALNDALQLVWGWALESVSGTDWGVWGIICSQMLLCGSDIWPILISLEKWVKQLWGTWGWPSLL